jgi:hypothetical protein
MTWCTLGDVAFINRFATFSGFLDLFYLSQHYTSLEEFIYTVKPVLRGYLWEVDF